MPSTVIRQTLYDLNSRRLVIVFQSGRRYAYSDVPPDIYEALLSAPSRGSFFNEWIRDRYSFECVDPGVLLSEKVH